MVQNALKYGRLDFVDKQKPPPMEETKTKSKTLFVEPVDTMVINTIGNIVAEDGKLNH